MCYNRIIRITGLAALTALTGFFACGTRTEEKPQASEQKAAKPAQIVISVNNGAQEGDENRFEEQRRINALFQSHYPNAKIEFSTWQFTPETFLAKIAGGTCTDVVGLFATEGTTVIEKGLALDITDYVANWDKYKCLNKKILEPFTRDGRIYGLPVGGIGGCYVMNLFFNKKMFRDAGIVDENGNPKPPDTWEEFVETAQKLTNREKGVAGFGILGETGGAGWHFLNWVWQAGGDFEKKINGKWKAVFDSPEAVAALQFIKDLRWKYDVLQQNLLASNDDLFEQFASERIAMALFTPEYLVYLVEKLHYPIKNIGIALLPAGPAGRANQMGGAYSIINPNIAPEKRQMAFNVIVFDYELDTIELKCRTEAEQGRIVGYPVLPVFAEEYQSKIDAIIDKYRTVPAMPQLMRDASKYLHPEPPYFSQQLYHEFLSPAVQAVLTDKNADPATLLHNAARDFQKRFLDQIK
jgi:multiple sugar transport system substrate-binding protein